MVTDEMLKQATNELVVAMNESLPNTKECIHRFSVRFERKMKRLIRKEKHPILHRTLSAVASVLIVIILGVSSLLVVSVEAREHIYKWIRQQYETYYEYYFDGAVEDSEVKRYRLNSVPDGYSLMASQELDGGEVYIYSSEKGNIMQFSYTSDEEIILHVEGVDYIQHDVKVNDMTGVVYLAPTTTESNGIVWIDNDRNIIFSISAFLDKDELISLAENVVSSE